MKNEPSAGKPKVRFPIYRSEKEASLFCNRVYRANQFAEHLFKLGAVLMILIACGCFYTFDDEICGDFGCLCRGSTRKSAPVNAEA